jgi:hypothetical protein
VPVTLHQGPWCTWAAQQLGQGGMQQLRLRRMQMQSVCSVWVVSSGGSSLLAPVLVPNGASQG